MTISELVKKLFSKFTRRRYDKQTDKQYISDEILKELKKGIKKGESIPNLAKRVQSVSNRSRNSAITTARTETTRIMNKGREDAYRRAESLGIKVARRWNATADSRVRDSHAAIDGEIVGMDEPFSNGLLFPGDLNGPPEEVINCRCVTTPEILN